MMKKFRIGFKVDSSYKTLVVEADNQKEARGKFGRMLADEIMDMSGMIPCFKIEDVEDESND